MGYEQQFFAKKLKTDFSDAGDTCELQLAACEGTEPTVNVASHSALSILAGVSCLVAVSVAMHGY